MSDLTGLDPLEAAVVEVCASLGANPAGPHTKCARIVTEVERSFGYGPHRAYEALLDLARPWVRWRPLVDVHGNVGSPDFPAAEARYTECRLTRSGVLAAEAESRNGPALPLGLFEGTVYRGGHVAPCHPGRLGAALRVVADSSAATDDVVLTVLGAPAFPTGGDVTVEDGLIRVTARIEVRGDVVEITELPPGGGAQRAMESIAARRRHLPIRALTDVSDSSRLRVRCELKAGAVPAGTAAALADLWGVTVAIRATPVPLESIRSWVDEHWASDTPRVLSDLQMFESELAS